MPKDMQSMRVEAAARAMARELGDEFDELPINKADWVAKGGKFGGRHRDVNEPRQCDLIYAAEAAIAAADAAMAEAGYVVVPREPIQAVIYDGVTVHWDGRSDDASPTGGAG